MRDVNCVFYYTGKSMQSTQQPTYGVDDTEIKCELFEPLDILSPVIIIDEEHRNDLQEGHIYHHIMDYNYVYIQSPISRYYWITGRERRDGLWYLSCSEDYLASFRDDILKTEQYVLRCGNSDYWDNNILDNNYLASATTDVDVVEFQDLDSTWHGGENIGEVTNKWSCIVQGNWFALGDATGEGSKNVIQNTFGGLTLPTNKMLYNMLSGMNNRDKDYIRLQDYLTDFYFLPFSIFGEGYSTTEKDISYIYYGNQAAAIVDEFKGSGEGLGKTWDRIEVGTILIDRQAVGIPYGTKYVDNFFAHIPQKSIAYENTSSLTNMYVQFEPFGMIPINSDIYARIDTLHLRVEVDILTGDAILYVRHPIQGFMHLATSNVAIRTPIKGTTTNARQYELQSGTQAINFVASTGMAIAGAATGNYLLAATSLASSASTLIQNADRPPMQTYSAVQGSPGSSLIDKIPKLFIYRKGVVGRDDGRFGRPCCQKLKLSQLGAGFVQCQKARFWGAGIGNRASAAERQAIENALNGGIYID